MCKGLLILGTRTLNNFRERVEHLTGNPNSLEEVGFSGGIYQFLAAVVPVKVHDRFLKSEQVVHSANYHIYSRRVTGLSPKVVLPFCSKKGARCYCNPQKEDVQSLNEVQIELSSLFLCR